MESTAGPLTCLIIVDEQTQLTPFYLGLRYYGVKVTKIQLEELSPPQNISTSSARLLDKFIPLIQHDDNCIIVATGKAGIIVKTAVLEALNKGLVRLVSRIAAFVFIGKIHRCLQIDQLKSSREEHYGVAITQTVHDLDSPGLHAINNTFVSKIDGARTRIYIYIEPADHDEVKAQLVTTSGVTRGTVFGSSSTAENFGKIIFESLRVATTDTATWRSLSLRRRLWTWFLDLEGEGQVRWIPLSVNLILWSTVCVAYPEGIRNATWGARGYVASVAAVIAWWCWLISVSDTLAARNLDRRHPRAIVFLFCGTLFLYSLFTKYGAHVTLVGGGTLSITLTLMVLHLTDVALLTNIRYPCRTTVRLMAKNDVEVEKEPSGTLLDDF